MSLISRRMARARFAASLPGFSDVTVRNLHLDARQTLRVMVTLAIAGLSEDVKVSAEAPAINTENGILSDSKTFLQVLSMTDA